MADVLAAWWRELQLGEKTPLILIGLFILVAGYYLARITGALVERGLKRREADPETSLLLARIIHWSILVTALLVAAQQVGVEITAFLAGLGILGFTVGFALQDVSKNFVAGMLILLQQPFELGDTLEVAGFTGTILSINLRDTEMRTVDGLHVRIPNADVFTSPILNYTDVPKRRIQINFGVAYDSDLAKIGQAVIQAVGAVPGVLQDPAIDFRFESFGDTAIQAGLYYWYDADQTGYSQALDGGIQAVQKALHQSEARVPLAPHAVTRQKLLKK